MKKLLSEYELYEASETEARKPTKHTPRMNAVRYVVSLIQKVTFFDAYIRNKI